MAAIPDAPRRVIPQIYRARNFHAIKQLGYEQIIWTLYRYRYDNEQVLEEVHMLSGPVAITMPRHRADSNLPMELNLLGIPTYVHTINSAEESHRYRTEQGVTEIYTDFLPVSEF